MTVELLFPDGADEVLSNWPTEPKAYARGRTELDRIISLQTFHELIDENCLAPKNVAVVKDGQAVHPGRYTTINGEEVIPGRLRKLLNDGHTISFRNLQQRIPFLARLSRDLQEEIGYPNHISGYLTPPGAQGLKHHWDAFTVFVVQLSGSKVWDLFNPVIDSPLFGYPQFSTPVVGFTEEQRARFAAGPPDHQFTLVPGDTLIVPRGTIHSPRAAGAEESFHLTFALKERSRLWLAEQLVGLVVDSPAFRMEVSPRLLTGDLESQLTSTRNELVAFLNDLDLQSAADRIRTAVLPEKP